MRVISQKGFIDVPYNEYVFRITRGEIYCLSGGERKITLAEYSSDEKAFKAMEMLRKQYAKLSVLKTSLSGVVNKSVVECTDTFMDLHIFRFPSDTDIA